MFRILEGPVEDGHSLPISLEEIDKKCRVMRFSELERAIPAISAEDAYSAVCESLRRDGMVLRHNYPQIPPGWNNQLTKVGIALRPRLACAPCMGGTSERSNAPVFIATSHLKCSNVPEGKATLLRITVGSKRTGAL